MVRMPFFNRGAASALTMILALAAGGVAGSVTMTVPAQAQQANYSPSRNFAKVYQPVADIANAAGGDLSPLPGGLLQTTRSIDPAKVGVVGLNGKPYDGHYGAYQYGEAGGLATAAGLGSGMGYDMEGSSRWH